VALLAASPVIDRWQNLPGLARQIRADTAHQSLALLDPDETTIAVLDHGLNTPFTVLSSAEGARQVVGRWFNAHGREARVLVLMPGHAPGNVSRWLERLHQARTEDEGPAMPLVTEGTAALAQRYQLPQGRRYALLAPPN
jgi:hypothetical protein